MRRIVFTCFSCIEALIYEFPMFIDTMTKCLLGRFCFSVSLASC
jgi:hypothetical protein